MPEASRRLRVGTRGSLLARTQTGWVVERLRSLGYEVVTETISTRGDVSTGVPISGIGGGDGVFVRELERALLEGRIDAAVHSLKDLPTAEPAGLTLAAVPLRATPFDAFVGRSAPTLAALPAGAIVGTSSVRRVMQLRLIRDDLDIRPMRGNVDSRLARLDEGAFDGVILAAAGLERLGFEGRITEMLRPDLFWPAVGQGALAVQVRSDDLRSAAIVQAIDHGESREAVRAERSCLASLAGGCLAPIGAFGRREAGMLVLGACVLGPSEGRADRVVASLAARPGETPEALGDRVAGMLVGAGADTLLAAARAGEAGRLPE